MIEVPVQAWVEPPSIGAREVRRDGITGENDLAEFPVRSVQGSVLLGGNHAIRDHEVDWRRRADVENAAIDSFSRGGHYSASILGPRHSAEHFLHAERDSSPIMRFDRGHGHDEIRSSVVFACTSESPPGTRGRLSAGIFTRRVSPTTTSTLGPLSCTGALHQPSIAVSVGGGPHVPRRPFRG